MVVEPHDDLKRELRRLWKQRLQEGWPSDLDPAFDSLSVLSELASVCDAIKNSAIDNAL